MSEELPYLRRGPSVDMPWVMMSSIDPSEAQPLFYLRYRPGDALSWAVMPITDQSKPLSLHTTRNQAATAAWRRHTTKEQS